MPGSKDPGRRLEQHRRKRSAVYIWVGSAGFISSKPKSDSASVTIYRQIRFRLLNVVAPVYLLTCIHVYYTQVSALNETTTIRVSKKTAEALEHLRTKLNAASLDEAIQSLVKKQRKSILEQAFCIDQGSIQPFTEEDRGEDRD